MQEIIINKNEAGQRFDKYLFKYFKEAPSSFIYKMLRKKNIELNSKKATGNEKLIVGDIIKLFMADDTIAKFRGNTTVKEVKSSPIDTKIVIDNILYEDEDILIINNPFIRFVIYLICILINSIFYKRINSVTRCARNVGHNYAFFTCDFIYKT